MAAFWSSLAIDASEVEHYETIEDMARSATAVIVGRVEDVSKGRTITDPETGDSVTYPQVSVQVVNVLVGQLPTLNGQESGVIILETIVPPVGHPGDGLQLLFLRWKGEGPSRNAQIAAEEREIYRLVNAQGVFVEGPDGARNPLSEAQYGFYEERPSVPVDPLLTEVAGRGLDQLIADIAAY